MHSSVRFCLLALAALVTTNAFGEAIAKKHAGGGGGLNLFSDLFSALSGGDPPLVSPGKALKGRDTKIPIKGKHYVLGNDLEGLSCRLRL